MEVQARGVPGEVAEGCNGACFTFGIGDEALVVDHAQVVRQLGDRGAGLQRESIAEHAALDVVIEQNRDDRIFEAGHDQHVVDELVVRSPHVE